MKECEYCSFTEEYRADEVLEFKTGYLSDCADKKDKSVNEIRIVENYDDERHIELGMAQGNDIFIRIFYCPICGRKL